MKKDFVCYSEGMNETLSNERSKFVSPSRELATDPHIKAKVIEAIAMVYEGVYLKNALAKVGLTRFMFSSCISGERELANSYAQARKVSADFLVDDAIEAVMTEENQLKARNVADMNRWAAGKFDAKYNDRLDINVTQTLDIGATLLEARRRLQQRPMSDQQLIEDEQVIDSIALPHHRATDKESAIDLNDALFTGDDAQVNVTPGDELDIFS